MTGPRVGEKVMTGSLEIASLGGILQLLSSEERTGRIDLACGDGAEGRVWLDAGSVVAAALEPGGRTGEDAFHALLEAPSGDFCFDPSAAPPATREIASSTAQLLLEAACRRDHRQRDAGGDLSPDAVPALAPVTGGGAERFDTMQWRVLAAVDGRTSLEGLARALALPLAAVTRIVSDLVRSGAVEIR